jgi:hypothetical protein
VADRAKEASRRAILPLLGRRQWQFFSLEPMAIAHFVPDNQINQITLLRDSRILCLFGIAERDEISVGVQGPGVPGILCIA